MYFDFIYPYLIIRLKSNEKKTNVKARKYGIKILWFGSCVDIKGRVKGGGHHPGNLNFALNF